MHRILWLALIFWSSAAHASPKIYDCFLFYNELEVLEIKLHELYDSVDYFVLVESAESFRGKPKPLYFDENKYRFIPFMDKIIHVIVADRFQTDDPWKREAFQRNQILRGLSKARDDDFVIIEDLDEILKASRLPDMLEPLISGRLRLVTCNHELYTYYLNRRGHTGHVSHMLGSIVTRYADVKERSPQGIRLSMDRAHAIFEAGWHFTYMGGPHRVRNKLENFSHSELDNESYKDLQRIRADVESIELVEIDATYPQYIQDNVDYFAELGLLDSKASG